jgi:hypothetical protein
MNKILAVFILALHQKEMGHSIQEALGALRPYLLRHHPLLLRRE